MISEYRICKDKHWRGSQAENAWKVAPILEFAFFKAFLVEAMHIIQASSPQNAFVVARG
jgi:hypothetical protein